MLVVRYSLKNLHLLFVISAADRLRVFTLTYVNLLYGTDQIIIYD